MSLSWLLTNLVATILLPPVNGLLPALLGLAMQRRRPRLGRGMLAFGLLLLTLLSLPVVAGALLRVLERQYPALPPTALSAPPVDAVVILGSGRYRKAPEFGGEDDAKGLALDRLRYGALVARRSGKPVLVAGGSLEKGLRPEAEIMRDVLKRDFGVATRWVEERSENTRENALYSAKILLPQGVRRIALVTHAFHMPRAVGAFEAAGFDVLPAPTVFLGSRNANVEASDFMPGYDVMHKSGYALHELIGLLWYRLRA